MRLVCCAILLVTAALITSCDKQLNVDRAASPEASFEAARASLQSENMDGFFDALTDQAVRQILLNSVLICVGSTRPETREFGYEPSFGCLRVLERYGWTGPTSYEQDVPAGAWEKAVAKIEEPRRMASDLESINEMNGAGVSFVWDHLDSVEIYDVEVNGDHATASAKWWGQDVSEIRFEKDDSGWRFNPYPE